MLVRTSIILLLYDVLVNAILFCLMMSVLEYHAHTVSCYIVIMNTFYSQDGRGDVVFGCIFAFSKHLSSRSQVGELGPRIGQGCMESPQVD